MAVQQCLRRTYADLNSSTLPSHLHKAFSVQAGPKVAAHEVAARLAPCAEVHQVCRQLLPSLGGHAAIG